MNGSHCESSQKLCVCSCSCSPQCIFYLFIFFYVDCPIRSFSFPWRAVFVLVPDINYNVCCPQSATRPCFLIWFRAMPVLIAGPTLTSTRGKRSSIVETGLSSKWTDTYKHSFSVLPNSLLDGQCISVCYTYRASILFPSIITVSLLFRRQPSALEKTLETALLLSLGGVGCVVLNQWHSSLQQNAHKMDKVLDSRCFT